MILSDINKKNVLLLNLVSCFQIRALYQKVYSRHFTWLCFLFEIDFTSYFMNAPWRKIYSLKYYWSNLENLIMLLIVVDIVYKYHLRWPFCVSQLYNMMEEHWKWETNILYFLFDYNLASSTTWTNLIVFLQHIF